MTEPSAPNRWKPRWGAVLPWLLVLAFGIPLGLLLVAYRPPPPDEQAHTELQAILTAQEAAWNRGDLDGFMAHYWNSEQLIFLSGADVTTGWRQTYQRYQKRYKSEGREMGRLKFTLLDVEILRPDVAVIRGGWALSLTNGDAPNGLFTLLVRKFDGLWKIVSDHTSVAEKK